MHVGEVCVHVRRSTNERKWLQCHPEDNGDELQLISLILICICNWLRSVAVNTHTMSHPVVSHYCYGPYYTKFRNRIFL